MWQPDGEFRSSLRIRMTPWARSGWIALPLLAVLPWAAPSPTDAKPAAGAGITCGWTTLVPERDTTDRAAPYGRVAGGAVVDTAGDRLVVFGGDGGVATGDSEQPTVVRTKNDVWTLSLGADPQWTELLPSGPLPDPRRDFSAILDAPRRRMIVFGGRSFDDAREAYWPDDSATVWSLSLDGPPAWSVLSAPAILSTRHGHAAAFDPVRERMWVFGGVDNLDLDSVSPHLYYFDLAGPPQWVFVAPAGPPAGPIVGAVMVHDSKRDRLLLFGGDRAFSGPVQEVLALDDLDGTPTWSVVAAAGTPPAATRPIRGVYDPIDDQLVIVGPTETQALTLSGIPRWKPPRPHSRRTQPSVAYDADADRVLLFGGELGSTGQEVNDVLEWQPGPSVNAAASPGEAGHVQVDYHDDCPETVTLTAMPNHGWDFSGWTGDLSGTQNPVTLLLDAEKNVTATFQVSTATLVARFDATRTAAGVELRWSLGDPARVVTTTLERRLDTENAWRALALPVRSERDAHVALDASPEAAAAAVYRLRLALAGGTEVVAGPVRASTAVRATSIESVTPNPSFGPTSVAFTLERDGPVELDLFDVDGRRVARLVTGPREAGRYVAVWDGWEAGRRPSPGVYFARLTASGRSVTQRFVLAR